MAGILNAELAFPQFPALDQFGPNTTLLLHGDGTNGAQNNTFLDSSANNFTITRNGNTTQGTFSPFSQPNGWWSNYFVESTTSRLRFPSGNILPSTGNFTLECWIWPIPVTNGYSVGVIASQGTQPNTDNGRTGFSIRTNGNVYFSIGESYTLNYNGATVPFYQWSHLAVTRSGTTFTYYINGKAVASNTSSKSIDAGYFNVGTWIDGDGVGYLAYSGYISNLRIVSSVVYSSNFTPSATPLTAVSGTNILTCQSNRFLDNSSNAYSPTVTGTPSVQSFHPISAPTAYYPAVNGGAGYFDGSGDYLATPTSSQPTASGDFTISCWFYLQSFAASYYAVGGNWTSGTSGEWLIQIQNNGTIRFLTTGDSTFAGTVRLNEWTYFSASRSGTTVTVQLNGSTIRTYTLTGTLGVANETINIGQQVGNNWPWNGYIADFNFNTTTATTAVPTAPASVVSGTSLLLKFQNAGIIDSVSQNQLETVGSAQISTTQSKFGASSMYFDGSSYISSNPSPNLILGASDFTVEYWVYFSSLPGYFGTVVFGTGLSSSGSAAYDAMFGWYQVSSSGGNLSLYLSSAASGWDIASNVVIIPAYPALNTWHHVAITRSGSTFRTFWNGNQQATFTSSASIYQSANSIALGTAQGGKFNGYLEDVRITKGIARYTQNFTPPQNAYPNYGPLTNIPTVDPNFKNTTLLLHGNGTNGAQNNTFLDSSTNNFTITRNGNTTQGTFTPFSQPDGWWSNYFDGSSRLLVAQTTPFNFGAGAFTVECWIYRIGNGSGTGSPYDCVLGGHTGAANTWGLYIYQANNYPSFYVNGSLIEAPIPIQNNTWTHLAAVRDGSGNVGVYVNGTLGVSSSNSGSITVGASGLYIAQDAAINDSFYGYISNVRVIKGQAAYASSFTPSTLPLTTTSQGITAANVSLLTCQSNYFKDNSTNSYAVAVASGTPSVQNFYPFFPPLDYSTAAIGGSAYFDGSGDYLTVPYGSGQMDLTNQDFAIEFWAYIPIDLQNKALLCQDQNYYQLVFSIDSNVRLIIYSYQSLSSGGALNFTLDLGRVPQAQWTYFTLTRTGSTVAGYVNGVRIATASYSGTITAQTGGWNVGAAYGGNAPITGYMSDVRFTIGSNPYGVGTTISVPTAPLTTITNTQLLLSCTNGGIFDNASKNDLETVGNAQISTTQSKFGGSSIYLNGSGNYLLSSSAQAYNKFGSADFTVEYWIYLNSSANQQAAVVCGAGTGGYDPIFGWVDSSALQLYLSSAASSWDIASAVTIIPATVSTGVWYHVAVTRNGSTFRTFCNGVQQATFTSSASIYQSAGQINIGRYASGYPINAYFDDIRITNGVSRYNYNFTPPAAPFPNK